MDDLAAYPWTSYAFYAFGKPDSLLTPNPLYGEFGYSLEERQKQYRSYLLPPRPYEKLIEEGLRRI